MKALLLFIYVTFARGLINIIAFDFSRNLFKTLGLIIVILITTLSANAQYYGVYTWGNNQLGQLGLGNTVNQPIPVRIDGDFADVVAVSGGGGHSLALRSNGTVLAWGANNLGQLGNGTASDSPALTPQPVPNLTNVVKIIAGINLNFVIKSDGTVWAWGYSSDLLGIGPPPNNPCFCVSTPVQVHNLSNIVSVKVGGSHALALDSTGRVWAWGFNSDGQLGTGSSIPYSANEPILITSPDLHNVIDIAAGYVHSLAVRNDGTVWAWGNHGYGQLGKGINGPYTVYSPVQVVNLSNVTQVTAGRFFSMALKLDGTVWAWGDDNYNNLGDLKNIGIYPSNECPVIGRKCESVPVQTAIKDVTSISSAQYFTLARKRDGTLWGWGNNDFGQIGISGFNPSINNPVRLAFDAAIFSTGATHSLVSFPQIPISTGNNVSVNFGDVTFTFDAVYNSFNVSIRPDNVANRFGGFSLPSSLKIYPNIQSYFIGSDQSYVDNPKVCFKIPGVISPQKFSELHLLRANSNIEEVPTTKDYSRHEICGVTTLSNFFFFAVPKVTETIVSGRVANRLNQPLKGVFVRLVSSTGETRTAITSPSGYYRFTAVPTDDTYLISVKSKQRYTFKAATIDLDDEVTGLDFTSIQ